MRPMTTKLAGDDSGAAVVEFSIVAMFFFVLTFGLVEFSFALWQWNSASKATQLGARLAAVSDPVWTGLKDSAITGTVGGTVAAYDVECRVSACTGSGGGADMTADTTALQLIVDGRPDFPGMRDIFYRVAPENVIVRYYNSGLGFAGRPGGPVPTITVRLTGLTFDFIALDALLGFGSLTMPDFVVTMTGEDLCFSSPSAC